MAEQLKSCDKSREELARCATRLYSAESFLYKLVNSTLRSNDMSKVDTLGPFCCLLYQHLSDNRSRNDHTLYRGVTLTEEMIEEYKQNIGEEIRWSAFTSTTKDCQVAEQFGNTLFIIAVKSSDYNWLSDISHLSNYPYEQEVLLDTQRRFKVDKIEHDPTNGKYLIYMTYIK